ncbi:MAG: hypothetical protein GY749_06545, partial [Desulfobacteraceae bacterium]|nr:hypothetical protein [Desulfobacteraceae bacterium]
GRIHKLGDSLKIPLVLVPMLRVGMQGAALRADIPRRNLSGKSQSPNSWIRPMDTEILSVSEPAATLIFRAFFTRISL